MNVSYLFQFSYDLIDILWQLHRYSVKLYSDMVEDTKKNVSPSIHTLLAEVLFHLCQPQVYPTLPLYGCLLALTMSFFSRFILISNAYFKFRKAELRRVLWGKKALYFHNCMLSIFNVVFGHHNLFVWLCWHVFFRLLRQRGQNFPACYPLWRRGLSWAVSQCRI